MDTQNVIPLRKVAEELGIADLKTLQKAAKKFGALIIVAGLEYVDRTRFDEGVKSELQSKIDQAERRSKSKDTNGRKIGLLNARIKRAPGLISGKEKAVTAAAGKVEKAPNRYEKSRAKKELLELEASLIRHKENFSKDKAELDRILNEEPEA